MNMIRTFILAAAVAVLPTGIFAQEIKIALDSPPDLERSGSYVWAHNFAEALKAAGLEAREIPRDAIGGEAEKLDQLSIGLLEVSLSDVNSVGRIDPFIMGVRLPYIFDDVAHMDRVMAEGDILDVVNEGIVEAGVRVLALVPLGPPSGIINTRKPIRQPEDLRGLRMRALDDAPADPASLQRFVDRQRDDLRKLLGVDAQRAATDDPTVLVNGHQELAEGAHQLIVRLRQHEIALGEPVDERCHELHVADLGAAIEQDGESSVERMVAAAWCRTGNCCRRNTRGGRSVCGSGSSARPSIRVFHLDSERVRRGRTAPDSSSGGEHRPWASIRKAELAGAARQWPRLGRARLDEPAGVSQ